jgi:predicted O-methyltransferase YrrM
VKWWICALVCLDIFPLLQDEAVEPFDPIFIDADKSNNPEYLSWALKFSPRSRNGTSGIAA